MKKLNPSLLLAAALALCANSALAQGTMLATWHNNYGPPANDIFQASFQIESSLLAPGSIFPDGAGSLFGETFTVTSPDHTWLPTMDVWYQCGFRGPGNTLYLDNIFRDPASPGVELDIIGAGGIIEYGPTGILFSQSGYFTFLAPTFPICWRGGCSVASCSPMPPYLGRQRYRYRATCMIEAA